jgi:hypothetical protein
LLRREKGQGCERAPRGESTEAEPRGESDASPPDRAFPRSRARIPFPKPSANGRGGAGRKCRKMGGVEPWWLAIASGIVLALTGAIGKLWSENRTLRRELGDAHALNAQLQADAFREHRRDLRVFAGLPTSGAPPGLDPLRPPIVIREAAPKRQRPAKKATE